MTRAAGKGTPEREQKIKREEAKKLELELFILGGSGKFDWGVREAGANMGCLVPFFGGWSF